MFEYTGNELTVFAKAKNWKNYWSKKISQYIGTKILDVGSGIGSTIYLLNKDNLEKIVSLEPDKNLCEILEKKRCLGELPENLVIKHGTIENIDQNERFDTVLYIDVLEHIENDCGELASAAEHLELNGRIVILSPAHQFLYTAFDKKIGHYRRYNVHSIKKILPESCEIECIEYLDSVGMLASIANKLFIKTSEPTEGQIIIWDSLFVRLSVYIDMLTLNRIGKSILVVLRKKKVNND